MPNAAPALIGSANTALSSTHQGAVNPGGTTIQALLASAADVDGDPLGAAILGLDTGLGAWQYSADGGITWLTIDSDLINSTTNELALLLAPADMIRLLPFGTLNGSLASAVTYRAWDQSAGAPGEYVVVGEPGGTSAFSSELLSASIEVLASNDAPTFSIITGSGKLWTDLGSEEDFGRSVKVLPDGRIVLAGSSLGAGEDFAVLRLHADGTIDDSFNGAGKALYDQGDIHNAGLAVTVQPDGKLIVAGVSYWSGTSATVLRINTDGTLDASFGTSGSVTVDSMTAGSVSMQPDGKIVLAGSAPTGADSRGFGFVRLNPDGTPDTSFNGSGQLAVEVGDFGAATGVTLLPDGRIVAAGYTTSDFGSYEIALVRVDAHGTLDAELGGSGVVSIPVGASREATGIAVQPDGKMIIVGRGSPNSSDFTVLRLNEDGTPDATFADTGLLRTLIGPFSSPAFAVALQADGKIVVAGGSQGWGMRSDVAVLRLNPDGTPDTSFNGTGSVVLDVNDSSDELALTLAVQPDGKIVLAGNGQATTDLDVFVLRLNADGTLDTAFNASPTSTLGGIASYSPGGAAVALDSSVAVHDAELAESGNYAGATVSLSRHGGASSDDVFSALGELSFTAGEALLAGVAIGTVVNTGGTLTITFNINATQARVNEALSSLGYANVSLDPPASVQIDWIFSDGNAGAQGVGGELMASASTTVILTTNQAPTGSIVIAGSALVGSTLSATNTLADADGIATPLAYQWKANGLDIDGATGDSLLISAAMVGTVISVTASYTDGAGKAESVTHAMTATVGTVVAALPGSTTLTGTVGDDLLVGLGKATRMIGGVGDDNYLVMNRKDVIIELGDEGNDTVISQISITLAANVENLVLGGTATISGTGNALDNGITGNIRGNALTGLLGADTLTGGAGGDRFIYTSVNDSTAAMLDTISDFNAAEGDIIDLRRIDANTLRNGSQAFTFIGSAQFSDFGSGAGLLRFDPATSMLEASVDADFDAEFAILLTGVTVLTAQNIIL